MSNDNWHPTTGAAAVIQDAEGRVLLVKHSYGPLNWELPGGGTEPDEFVVDTCVREVKEETDLDVSATGITGVYYEGDKGFLHFVFRCQIIGETASPKPDRQEVTECRWWFVHALPRPISDFTQRRIVDATSRDSGWLPQRVDPRQWLD